MYTSNESWKHSEIKYEKKIQLFLFFFAKIGFSKLRASILTKKKFKRKFFKNIFTQPPKSFSLLFVNTRNEIYTGGKKDWHSYLINTIEIRSLSMKMKCFKSAAWLLEKIWINKRDLNLSREVMLVSAGQRIAELQAVKVGSQKKNFAACPGPISRIFFFISNFDSP